MTWKTTSCKRWKSDMGDFSERSAMRTRTPGGKVAHTSATKCSLRRTLHYRNRQVVLRLQKDLREKGQEVTFAEAEAMFKKSLRFLWRSQNGGALAPTADEDEGWHVFILYTMDYQKFCHKYFGRFIHHNPLKNAGASLTQKGDPCNADGTDCYSCRA